MHNDYNLVAVDFDPFEGNEIEKVTITNEPQREVWLSCIIGGEEASLAYNESVSLDFEGNFNNLAFEKAMGDVIARHEALRAVISRNGENLIIYKESLCDIYTEVLSGADAVNNLSLVCESLSKEMSIPFDLYNGPLFRVYLYKISDDHHYFTIIIHHLIGDGWSIGIILEDLCSFYNAHLSGERPDLSKAEQISDYAQEQLVYSKSEEYKATTEFWLSKYEDHIPVLNLPLDFSRPAVRTYAGRRADYAVDHEILVQIKQLAAKTGSSLVVTLIAVFEVLLYHRTGQTDLVVGLPAAGQLATGNLGVVGHCVNLLPLLSKIDPEQSFISYLTKRRSEIYDAYDHQRLSFGELLRKLHFQRDKALIPLVPVVFNIDMGMDEKVQFRGLKHRLISNPRVSQTFEIFLNVNGSKDALTFEWAYNTQLFTSATIDAMMLEFNSLLKTITSTPNIVIADALVKESSIPKMSGFASKTRSIKTIADLFSAQVNVTPNHIAIKLEDKQISYLQLDAMSNQLANYLIEKGIKKESLVPICFNRSIEMVIGILGILKAGAAYVPIDPTYPVDRINYMLRDIDSHFIISNVKNSAKLSGSLILLDSDWDLISKTSSASPDVSIQPDQLLYIIYTSGSTGKPKGVMIEHQSLVNYITAQTAYFSITPRENILQFSNYCFDASMEQIFLALLNGACLILMPEELLTDISSFTRYLNEKQVTHLHATPAFLENMNTEEQYAHLKRIVSAGEICKVELAKKWLNRVDFYNKYGPTESTISVLEYHYQADEIDNFKVLPLGKAIKNTVVYILDEKLRPVRNGELYIGGVQLARGYFNQPDLTAKSFIDSPFVAGERLYKTGDLAKWGSNEHIEFLGRTDDQVKIRGIRIEIGEIENTLNEISEVKQCVVIAVDDRLIGKRLVAYVVSEGIFNKEQITHFLLQKLPEYMVPKHIISLDEIPLTSNGKVDRKKLEKSSLTFELERRQFQPPTTNEQILVAEIWRANLGITDISIDDDFFELGGHSLIAAKVMSSIEKKTGKRLPLAGLFEDPTISGLAKMLSVNEKEIKWDSLVPIKKTGTKTPIYMIHGAGLNVLVFSPLGRYMDQDQPVYGMQALGLNGKSELLYSMEDLADRYNAEILANDPVGPYALAGYSFGGLLAYEMARRLIEKGKEVKMLGILDTFAGNRDLNYSTTSKIIKKIGRQFKKVLFFGKLFITNPGETYHYQTLVIKRKINELFKNQSGLEDDVFSYEREINISYDVASKNYFMKPLDIKVDLFSVKKRVYFLDDPHYLGWKEYAMKGVDVHEVPGDHKTFLFAPNDKEFAEILQRVIDQKTNT